MDELPKEWDLLFKKKLSSEGDIMPHFEDFLNYISNEAYIVNKNCTPYCEVRDRKKVSLQTHWLLKKPGMHLTA